MAVTLTAEQLKAEVNTADTEGQTTRAARILAVATEKVSDYLGDAYTDAPESIVNEAVIRFGGYLAQSDYGTVRDERIGERAVSYAMNHAAMFRSCGAMSLLNPYKPRGAGAI